MENLQEALDKLKADKAKYIQDAQLAVNQQIAWFDGGIAALEAILNPPKEKEKDETNSSA